MATRLRLPSGEGRRSTISPIAHSCQKSRIVTLTVVLKPPSQQESLYGLVNAYTSAAQRLPDEQRYDLEVLAGQLAEHGVAAYAPRRHKRREHTANVEDATLPTRSGQHLLEAQEEVHDHLPSEPEKISLPINGTNTGERSIVELAREMFDAEIVGRVPREAATQEVSTNKGATMSVALPIVTVEGQSATVTISPHWSATRLKSLMLCPRQFRYAYIDLIPAVPTAPLVFGRVLHQTLLFIHQRQMEEKTLPMVVETLEQFDGLWRDALAAENPFFRAGAPTAEQQTKLGHEILRSYLHSVQDTKPPLAAELSFEIEVGEDKLRGVIDRIDEYEDGLVIVDFKSGARKFSAQEVERDLQLTVYAFAAQQLYGRPTARVAQFYLRDGTYLRSLRGPDDFAWLLADILPYARRVLREAQYPARIGYWCNWCDYRELCKAERAQEMVEQSVLGGEV